MGEGSGSAPGALERPPHGGPPPLPRCEVGHESGSQRRRVLVAAEKQSDHIHAIRSGWLGGGSVTHPSRHAPSDPLSLTAN